MQGLMIDCQLTLPAIMRRAAALSADVEILSRGADGVVTIGGRTSAPAGSLPYDELMATADAQAFAEADLDERDAAAMCDTSGTTGRPKGVVYSHLGRASACRGRRQAGWAGGCERPPRAPGAALSEVVDSGAIRVHRGDPAHVNGQVPESGAAGTVPRCHHPLTES
jgi:acyl-CoA synthetase (AMP-forming)/AMP-acid ligase II